MRNLILLTTAACILVGTQAGSAETKAEAARLTAGGQSVEFPYEEMKFQHTGVRDASPDIQIFDAYGKFGSGQHGTVMKFAVGFKSPLHTHTGDYYAVVIRGVMANYRPNGKVISLSPGSYWFQRGGEPHITECLSQEVCEAFLVQNVEFDAQLLEK